MFLLAGAALLLVLMQLQPLFLRTRNAVDGSFGLRPVSHQCAGLRLTGEWVARRMPPIDWEGNLGYFHARYLVPHEASGREFCLGQDIWFGE